MFHAPTVLKRTAFIWGLKISFATPVGGLAIPRGMKIFFAAPLTPPQTQPLILKEPLRQLVLK